MFASPPGADGERAELADEDREAEEAAQIAALDAAAEAEAAGDAKVGAKTEATWREEKALLARIREFYEVRAKRVEPIGLVYLWPDTG